MDAAQAASALAELFPDIYRRFCRRVSTGEYQPSPEALAVLNHLAHTGPLTVTEAARHLGRSQAAVSELIARLENRDLLARMADERDRRRTLIWLTPEGRQTLRTSREVLSPELLAAAMEQLSSGDRGKLIDALQALLGTNPQPRSNRKT